MWELKAGGTDIPGDLSLFGYDGITMGRMVHPWLATYRQNTAEIARETIALLLEAIEQPDSHRPRQITVAGTLIEGETVSAPSR
jgi:DNA-binding LacI/PurR family transcriptional regulator